MVLCFQGFFRRSLKKDKLEYKCTKNGDCKIMKGRRNNCPLCRYNKCLTVGMSKEGTLSLVLIHGNIRIHHECAGGIKKSVSRITDWHHKACRVMTKGDHEGGIFLSHPHRYNGFFFLLTTKYCIFIFEKHEKKATKNTQYVEMPHG